jgi:hypothetical protein
MGAFDWNLFFYRISQQFVTDFDKEVPAGATLTSADVQSARSAVVHFCDAVKACLVSSDKPNLPPYTLVIFDLSPKASYGVQFLGTLTPEETISTFSAIPTDDISAIRSRHGFTRWHKESDTVIQFALGDISTREEEYSASLSKMLLEPYNGILQQRLTAQVNFNSKYGLTPANVVEPSTFGRKVDVRTGSFLRDFGITHQPVLDQWQALIVNIQLVPQVTGSVAKTFDIAKRLFVFSLFEYEFATVSLHYGGLALESAIQNRWNLTLPRRAVTLEYKSSKNPQVLVDQMPTYGSIKSICKDRDWRGTVLVDGRIFPTSMKKLLRDLESQGVISAWQKRRLQFGLDNFRNALSHLEFKTLQPPNPKALVILAELINQLFDSVPVPPPVRGWGYPQF